MRANILDRARSSTATRSDQYRLALAAYQANGHAVVANPFDIYGGLHFAESTLTLANLGTPGRPRKPLKSIVD